MCLYILYLQHLETECPHKDGKICQIMALWGLLDGPHKENVILLKQKLETNNKKVSFS